MRDKGRPGAPAVKYDVAIGVSRVVEPPVAAVSTDSWIMTCVGGAVLLLVLSSTTYAAVTGVASTCIASFRLSTAGILELKLN